MFFLIAFVALIAMSVDIGYLQSARVEMQRSADAAAIAAAWELVGSSNSQNAKITAARAKAAEFAALNKVCQSAPVVGLNAANGATGDVVMGYLANPSDPNSSLNTSDPSKFNAVQVRVRRDSGQNGEIPLFFGRALGRSSIASETRATAAVLSNFSGFSAPTGSNTLPILPFALDKTTWDALVAGGGTDTWRWDSADEAVSNYSDGVKEVNLYPQGTGSPGNRGTVDIGGNNNSTSDIARQITDGISAADMEDFGRPLEFDAAGKLYLNGDTGISAGVKDDLASIIGQTRIMPIFEAVNGPGNNAMYTIVQWAGVRVMSVNLTGKMSSKRLIVQPATVVVRGGVPATGDQKTSYVYSPAWLVR